MKKLKYCTGTIVKANTGTEISLAKIVGIYQDDKADGIDYKLQIISPTCVYLVCSESSIVDRFMSEKSLVD